MQLAVKKIADRQVMVKVELAKDMPEGTEIFSKLEMIDDLVPILTAIQLGLLSCCPPTKPCSGKLGTSIRGRPSQQRVALDVLTECTAEHGKAAPASCELPGAVCGVTLEQWRAKLYRVGVLEPDEKKNPRTAFKRLQNSLQARKAIGIMDSFVSAGVAPVAAVAFVAPYKGGATCYATAALA